MKNESVVAAMKDNPIKDKSFAFAIRIVKFTRWLDEEGVNYKLINQVLRSGTSIGANVTEADAAYSKKDFAHKMSIAFKEANETRYWLELLAATDLIKPEIANSLIKDVNELIKLLATIIKSSKQ